MYKDQIEVTLTWGALKLALTMVRDATGGLTRTLIRVVLSVGKRTGLEFGASRIKYTQVSLFRTSVTVMELMYQAIQCKRTST